MKILIIDAAKDKIFFKIIVNNKSYTVEHLNNKKNFDNFVTLLFNFIKKNNLNIKNLSKIFVNQGPGKFSGIRTSLSVAKSICLVNNIDLYAFNSSQYLHQNHQKLIVLAKNNKLKKNLINPNYSS
ncbi:MAG: peptidase M22 [Candidatus Pelagibacter sp.]|tara:strand:- start:4135 stop:4512 length:378 start_codon:yes stop_codon:yes gene_type:complete